MGGSKRPSRTQNLAYAALAGQAGCATVGFVFVALFVGLWLDAQFGVRGWFTIGLLLLSIPISLFAMVRIALGMINEIKPQPKDKPRSDTSRTEEG
jgi:F0F1-type ATP synthase assembly protein I